MIGVVATARPVASMMLIVFAGSEVSDDGPEASENATKKAHCGNTRSHAGHRHCPGVVATDNQKQRARWPVINCGKSVSRISV